MSNLLPDGRSICQKSLLLKATVLWEEVSPQHHRRAAAFVLRVVRLDQRFKTRPRHDRIHHRQKHRLPGLAGLRQSHLSKTQLLHRFHQCGGGHDNGAFFSNQAVWRSLVQSFSSAMNLSTTAL